MGSLESLQQLVPAVAISVVLSSAFGWIIMNILKSHRESIERIEELQAQAHRDKVTSFLDETRRKDEMLNSMVTGVFEKVNVSMEKQSTSLDKFTAVLDQFLRGSRR